MEKELKTLISSDELFKKIQKLADDINLYYEKNYSLNEELTIVCVLKGAVMFFCRAFKIS